MYPLEQSDAVYFLYHCMFACFSPYKELFNLHTKFGQQDLEALPYTLPHGGSHEGMHY